MSGQLIARVLLDTPLPQLDHLFDYEVPEHLKQDIKLGQRVKVPFRSRQRDVLGYVVELGTETDFAGKLATLTEIISPVPIMRPEIWRLARAVADRAGGSAGDILRVAIPPRHLRAEKAYFAEANKQVAVGREGVGGALESGKGEFAEGIRNLAKNLSSGGRFHLRITQPPVQLESGEWVLAWAKQLSEIAVALQRNGKSAIIVLPDFRDVAQVLDTLQTLGAERVIKLDSRQSASARYKEFLRALEPAASIVVGNRSAVYAPAHNLGAVIIWDEADSSLDEPLSPYVHARDVALVRTADGGVNSAAGLLFASHTRSTQMQRLIDMKYLAPLFVGGARARVIHSGALAREEEYESRLPEVATNILRAGLKSGPVLVQVAGVGYAGVIVCARCKDVARCRSCHGSLASAKPRGLACRLCADPNTNWRCETCGETALEARGAGSERTAEQFEQIFAGTPIILSDGNHKRLRVDARPAVVVATRGSEPIAMGGYKAVVILDAGRYIDSWHLRAGEDALRWWHGAAAHAVAGASCVIAGGGGPLIKAFVQDTEEAWLRAELRDRADLRFPPAVRVATVTGLGEPVREALAALEGLPGVDFLGPTKLLSGDSRAIVRFDYGQGAVVATKLRAELLRSIAEGTAKRHVQTKARQQKGLQRVALRLRFDDETAFDDRGSDEAGATT